jgi:hypothetical protein
MADEKIFADGFSFKRDEAIVFLKQHAKGGWVNLDIKQAKGGNYYCELDTWEAKPQNQGGGSKVGTVSPSVVEEPTDDLPF